MAHNIVVLNGHQICSGCGRTDGWWNVQCISPSHNIVAMTPSQLQCTKCGRTDGWWNIPCQP